MRILLLTVFGSLLISLAFSQDTPKTMLKVSARLVPTNGAPNSFANPGPSFDVHIPIFHVSGEAKKNLDALEFGSELQFFTGNGAKQSPGEIINGKATDRYDATVSGSKLTLWTDAKSKKPVRVSLITGTQTQTIEYLAYEDNLPFDPSLFRPPTGIAMQEPK